MLIVEAGENRENSSTKPDYSKGGDSLLENALLFTLGMRTGSSTMSA
jgi:hypothetical protein